MACVCKLYSSILENKMQFIVSLEIFPFLLYNSIATLWMILWKKVKKWSFEVIHEKCLSFRSSHPEVFLEKKVFWTYAANLQENIHPKQLYWNHTSAWHGCSPLNLLHIFRKPFLKNSSGGLLLNYWALV